MTLRDVVANTEVILEMLSGILRSGLPINERMAQQAHAAVTSFLLTLPEYDDRKCPCAIPDCTSKIVQPEDR